MIARVFLLAAAIGLAATACSGAGRPTLTDDTAPPRNCSAEDMGLPPVDAEGIVPAVSSTRQAVIDAAVACDWDALIDLASTGPLSVTIDGQAVPVDQWEAREGDGQPILRFVAGVLALPPAEAAPDGVVSWPSALDWAFSDVAPGDERQALADVVGEDGIYGWAETGGYAGWRTSITGDGTWASVASGPEPD